MLKVLAINATIDLSFQTSRGLKLDIQNITVPNLKFPLKFLYQVKDTSGAMVDLYTPDVASYLETNHYQADIIFVGWSPNDYGTEVSHTGGYTCPVPLSNGSFWATVRQDTPVVEMYAQHEAMHLLIRILWRMGFKGVNDFMDTTLVNGVWMPYYENDPNITDPLSNFNQTFEQIKPYISNLNSITYHMYTPRHFAPKEIVGLKDELVMKLDDLRDFTGQPMIITSGFRSPLRNALVGGVSGSTHTLGLGCDVACNNDIYREQLIKGALQVGFNRIGIYASHLHLDVGQAPAFPQSVMWVSGNE